MDTTLAVNPGSSSKKYALFREGRMIFSVLFEHVGDGYGKCVEVDGERQQCEEVTAGLYAMSLQHAVALAQQKGILSAGEEVTNIGVRIVAPGIYFEKHRIIDAQYIEKLHSIEDAAPLHIPHVVSELTSLQELFPKVQKIGVSDSAFHSTVPEHTRKYSIPTADAEKFELYRYGYHGLSVSSVVSQAKEKLGIFPKRAIVCHVGSGVSVTTLLNGESVDTTMGFSPTSGLMMGSRAGDLDSSALLYLMKKKDLSPLQAEKYINEQGGFIGAFGQSDLRIVLDRMARGDRAAKTAVTMYTHQIKKAIGAGVATLGGIDLLILTATAAERNPMVRSLICSGLEGLGIVLDVQMNEACMGHTGSLSNETQATKIFVLHTSEMNEISREANVFIGL
ncbi:MAG: hypothetical protein K9M10_02840 [Candidatus Pacebacteria bacterium]|nr:hypothetical protein [Candidatus Paceibacterota bacterium]MCF7857389.1 hypothetical protein [Candidatus Paceibacterota bacterium]